MKQQNKPTDQVSQEILPLLFSSMPLFPYPTPIRAKIEGCSLWSRSVMSGSAESQVPKLITGEIIFAEFQSVWSQSTNITDGQTDRWTDNLSWQYRATL